MPNGKCKPAIGARLAVARLQRGLSQGQVGRRTGIAPSYLSRIETGKIQPSFKTVQRIADAIHIPLEEIAGPGELELSRHGACPVSSGGACMLDLIHPEAEVVRGIPGEAFSPRQIKLIARFAAWLRRVSPDRQRAMEILLNDLSNSNADSRARLPERPGSR